MTRSHRKLRSTWREAVPFLSLLFSLACTFLPASLQKNMPPEMKLYLSLYMYIIPKLYLYIYIYFTLLV